MDTNVLITINSSQDDQEAVKFITQGRYFYNDGIPTLEYDESEMEGMQGCIARISFEEGSVLLEHVGSAKSKIYFKEKQYTSAVFSSGAISLSIDVLPCKIKYELTDSEGYLDLRYFMNIGNSEKINNNVFLQYRSK